MFGLTEHDDRLWLQLDQLFFRIRRPFHKKRLLTNRVYFRSLLFCYALLKLYAPSETLSLAGQR